MRSFVPFSGMYKRTLRGEKNKTENAQLGGRTSRRRVYTRKDACARHLIIPRESGNFPFYRSPTFHNPWQKRVVPRSRPSYTVS